MTRQEMMRRAFGIVSTRRQKAVTLADQRRAAARENCRSWNSWNSSVHRQGCVPRSFP